MVVVVVNDQGNGTRGTRSRSHPKPLHVVQQHRSSYIHRRRRQSSSELSPETKQKQSKPKKEKERKRRTESRDANKKLRKVVPAAVVAAVGPTGASPSRTPP